MTVADETIYLNELPYALRWRLRREAVRLTQRELAEKLRMKASTLSAYETDARMPADPADFERRHLRAVQEAASGRLLLTVPANLAAQVGAFLTALHDRSHGAWQLRAPRKISEDAVQYEVEVREDAG